MENLRGIKMPEKHWTYDEIQAEKLRLELLFKYFFARCDIEVTQEISDEEWEKLKKRHNRI